MTNETERARAFYEEVYDYDHSINYGRTKIVLKQD